MESYLESFRSYPKIYALGHKAIEGLFKGPCIVEEKLDGSQFSFGVGLDGKINVRSRGVVMDINYPEGMFKKACEWVFANFEKLHPGWTYRAEFLGKPKQNTLAYDRVPTNNLAIIDINDGLESYLSYSKKLEEAGDLGLECVRLIDTNGVDGTSPCWTYEDFRKWLQIPSMLGGQLIEGIVIKNYTAFGGDGKVLMGKYVSEQFKEAHGRLWTKESKGSMLERLIASFKTEARWMKAVQHLKERGELLGDPRDIGNLFQEVQKDFEEEEGERVSQLLFKEYRKDLMRGITKGMPDWYKDRLARQQWEPIEALTQDERSSHEL